MSERLSPERLEEMRRSLHEHGWWGTAVTGADVVLLLDHISALTEGLRPFAEFAAGLNVYWGHRHGFPRPGEWELDDNGTIYKITQADFRRAASLLSQEGRG